MNKKFEVIFLEEAIEFLESLNGKTSRKIFYNIDKASFINDPKLFKKLNDTIWEFRTLFDKSQYRLLAFWDKEQETDVLVVTTHGFVKKTSRVPRKEIQKAERIRKAYFDEKK